MWPSPRLLRPPVKGYNTANPGVPILLNPGSSDVFGLAPAIEYNLTSKLGFLVGTRPFPWGRNTSYSITPAVAVNYVTESEPPD